ncbi:hypothetical protein [Listeria booriae]|uniref:Lipoprotein n=1 Tax=Listeria booriae TaxID=1552123 RepID=A0A7X0ZS97_9LIST|nr:hypothetical protein [Listeria booriae]MBC2304174.1 hypothetical protein [Listeria booriae]MBC2309570.1 hypothetical protein [Listeria booriae]
MKYLVAGMISLVLAGAISGCASPSEKKSDKKTKPNNVAEIKEKQYTSIEDYQKEIPSDMQMNKPVFQLVGDTLEISFEVQFTEAMDTKLRNTKQPSYYSVIEAEGHDKFDKLLDKNNPPIYSNNVAAMESGSFGYKYKAVLALQAKPTASEKKELLDGSNFALVFMNQNKDVTNVFHVLDIGMVE